MEVTFNNRLKIRPVIESDIDNIYRGLSDPRVIEYYGVSCVNWEDAQNQMNWYKQLILDKTGAWWVLEDKINGDFLGACGLNNMQKKHRKAEIGYWLLPEFWAKGFAKEAISWLIKYAWQKQALHRLEAYIEEGNRSSIDVLVKHGFVKEGEFQDYEIKNNKFITVLLYSLIKD